MDLGTGSGKKDVKIGTGITAPICEELTTLLRDYQDSFACSYQDMPGLSSDIKDTRDVTLNCYITIIIED